MARVLILGGYGTFGGRLARLLTQDSRAEIIVAGRSAARAQAFCKTVAGSLRGVALDRGGALDTAFDALKPDIVVDASGPFQAYGEDPYRVAKACVARGISYLDLADGADFVVGIAALDAEAQARGVFVLSGVSTFPALSMAAVRALTHGWSRVRTITAGVAPSPYVDLGRSVIAAIASYAGKPIALVRGGRRATGRALVEGRRVTVGAPGLLPLTSRRFALADVPDLQLAQAQWPELESVWTGVGTLPAATHRLLSVVSWLRFPLRPLAPVIHWVSRHLRWGEHRGGMFVAVTGDDERGQAVERSWHLVAQGDDGPFVPAMAAAAIIGKVLDGVPPLPGARAATNALALSDFVPFFARRAIRTGTATRLAGPLYVRFFNDTWEQLPELIRGMHDGPGSARGLAVVERGRNPLAWLAGAIVGFPKAGKDIPVDVHFSEKDGRETWRRRFAGKPFQSLQFEGRGRSAGLISERFGAVTIGLAMVIDGGVLRLVVRRWSFLGIPMPAWLRPSGDNHERVEDGRFRFHVEIRLPFVGLVVRYRGWLVRDAPALALGPAGTENTSP